MDVTDILIALYMYFRNVQFNKKQLLYAVAVISFTYKLLLFCQSNLCLSVCIYVPE